MPKENINYPVATAIVQVIGEDGPEPDEHLPASSQIALHWDANHGNVQLSFDIDLDTLKRIVAHREKGEVWDGSEEGRQILFTEQLSRADLQRMIRFARRARDAAYGADE